MQDRFGQVRFGLEYYEKSNKLHVTIIDAWDLPPMDKNGKSDPYVEVSIRPGKDVFKTATKHCSLNPTFNETFIMTLEAKDIDEGELMIKVLDSDFPLQDELIGIIRLPLNALELSNSQKHHTCLILHEKGKNSRHMMSSLDAAKLNLKISHQTQEVLDLQAQLRSIHENLEEVRDESKKMRTKQMDLEMNNFRLKTELDALSKLPEIVLASPDDNDDNRGLIPTQQTRTGSEDHLQFIANDEGFAKSVSGSFSSSSTPSVARKFTRSNLQDDNVEINVDHTKCNELKQHLEDCIKNREDEAEELKKKIQTLKPVILDETRNGQIDVGLAFLPDKDIFRISILSGIKIRAVDGSTSDPYCKARVYQQNKKIKTFETSVKWKNLAPQWNEEFDVKEITSDDLSNMHIEILVLDKNRMHADQSIGLIRIGPNHGYVDKHWEEMLKTPGEMVAKMHALRDI